MAASDDLTWSVSSATVGIGETITVSADYGMSPTESGLTGAFNGLATAVADGNWVEITGVAAGTVAVPVGTDVGNHVTTANAFTLTVTAPADDQNFLNERGLAHFWENVDDAKQNKLTAGAGISITNDVISATGGGVADSVAWGHITGSMSSQTDLTTALAAKANSADLATVATTGDYDDLTDKPTIGNAALTIQKNGTTVETFTANASSNVTANITVPINVSELTNDAGYITSYTDNKTAQTLTRPTTSTTYYPVASADLSTNTADVKKFSGVSLSYFDNEGGAAALTLGRTNLNGSVAGLISLVDSVGALGHTVIAGSGKISTGDHTLNTPDTSGRLVANSSSDSATGSATNPVYADSDGVLHATTYTLEKSVPSNAVFTDTTYSNATTSAAGLMSAADKTKLNGIATGAEVNVQSDWNVTDTASDAFIKNKPTLATVATSGSYDDLSDKPTIPAAQVQSDWAQTTTTAVDYIKNKPTLATVATSGSYSDLSNKPTIPAAQVNSDWNANSGVAQILNKPTFATVATSGSYNDLNNTPTIPTVNDATLTIKQNGTSLGTFTANASSNATIDVNAPKLTSLVGSVQTSDYHRSVVALCEVASGSGSTVNSWSSGKLVAHRNNGAYGVAEVDINIEAKRATAYYSNVSYFSNVALLSPTANIDTGLGFRPCTFKYNNVYYAGIEFYISSSSASNVYFSGVGNFDVFGLDYYSVAHGSTASSVLNSEVYNSLNYTQWNEERNQWRVGRATRDIIYNNGSGTNANFSTTTAMSNYDEVEISYRDGNQNYAFKRIPGPAGSFVLDVVHPGANSVAFWYISRYLVSGTNITVGANNMRKAIGASSITTTASQDIYITRIVGIRH